MDSMKQLQSFGTSTLPQTIQMPSVVDIEFDIKGRRFEIDVDEDVILILKKESRKKRSMSDVWSAGC